MAQRAEQSTKKWLETLREQMPRGPRRAVVLGGGGARGSYQIGVWKALRELDYRYEVVAGTSVGALNGCLMVQQDYEIAVELWESLQTQNVIELPQSAQELSGFAALHDFIVHFLRNGGVDPTPLENMLARCLDEEKVMGSPIAFGFVTVEFPSLKPVVLTKEQIPPGKLCDYLMASAACFPAMMKRQIDDKSYIDGAYYNNLPIQIALEKGADEIVAVDLDAPGIVQPVKLRGQQLRYVRCHWPLGTSLAFDPSLAKRNMRLGYLDTMKAFGQLEGVAFAFSKGELGGTYCQSVCRKFEALCRGESGVERLARWRVQSAVNREKTGNRGDLYPEVFGAMELTGELFALSPLEEYRWEQFHRELLGRLEEAKACYQNLLSALSLPTGQLLRDAGGAGKLFQALRENDKQLMVVYLMECLLGRQTLPGGEDGLCLVGATFSRELAAAIYLCALIQENDPSL